MKWPLTWLCLALAPILFTGCRTATDVHTLGDTLMDKLTAEPLTARLWDTDCTGPAPSPNLEVFQTKNHRDFIVVYDDDRVTDGNYTRRAYLLYANEKRIEAGNRPRFTSVRRAERLQPIPVETNFMARANPTNLPRLKAVLLSNHDYFDLVSDDRYVGTFTLPVYVNRSGPARRVLLTPPAMLSDATLYSSFVAGFAAFVCCAWVDGAVHGGGNNRQPPSD
jgi:hypothetical protein